jgi:PAS domain S-box-containing protein
MDQELTDLRATTADNPSFQQKMNVISPLISAKLASMQQTVNLRRRQALAPAVEANLVDQGQDMMDDILTRAGELEDEQNQLLQQKTDAADAREQTVNLSITFGSFLAIMLAVFMITREIVERKQTDAALRESAARFLRLADNALDLIYRYRVLPMPGFEYVSPAATLLTGYTPEEFYADPDLSMKLVHPEDRGLISSPSDPTSAATPLTMRWIQKDGTVIWTSQQLVPIYDADGSLVAVEGIVRDVTERMEAYQLLERRVEERTHEIERRRQVAEALRDIMTVLNSNRPLAEILDSIVAQACRLLSTDAGALYRLVDGSEHLSIEAVRGMAPDVTSLCMPLGWGPIGLVVQTRQPVAVANSEINLHAKADPELEPALQARLAGLQRRYRAVLAVPLMVKDDIYGAIALYYHEPHEFSNEEVELAVAFGDQAALAIENARLRTQAEQMAVAAERSRLARDLHDAVTQTLFSTSIIADVLPRLWERDQNEARLRLEELRQLTRGAMAEMRGLLLELRPATFTEAEIGELLRQLAEALAGRARIRVSVVIDGQRRLPANVQVAVYRIAQEALNNIARHAEASQVTVALCCRPDATELRIGDDGRGFNPGNIAPGHLGLSIMRERAEAIGATLQIDSRPGMGTQVVIICPQPGAAVETRSPALRLGFNQQRLPGGGYE